jgi:hypothetical protein
VKKFSNHICSSQQTPIQLGAEDSRLIDRREYLWRFGGGLGGIAMVHLLGHHGLLAFTGQETIPSPLRKGRESG